MDVALVAQVTDLAQGFDVEQVRLVDVDVDPAAADCGAQRCHERLTAVLRSSHAAEPDHQTTQEAVAVDLALQVDLDDVAVVLGKEAVGTEGLAEAALSRYLEAATLVHDFDEHPLRHRERDGRHEIGAVGKRCSFDLHGGPFKAR